MSNPVINWRKAKKLHSFLGKKGKLLAWTKIYAAPVGFEHEAPYFTGIVQFADGSKKSLQIIEVNGTPLEIGVELTTVLRRLGKAKSDEVIDYAIKAKPIVDSGSQRK